MHRWYNCDSLVFVLSFFRLFLSTTDAPNVGTAVGASVGVFLLFCCCGIPLCIGILIYGSNRRRPTLQTRVVTTAPPTSGATTVVATTQQETVTAAPMAYPTHPPPAPYPPQPQNMYKDAQFSSGVPPPAYETAAGYPPQVVDIVATVYVRWNIWKVYSGTSLI